MVPLVVKAMNANEPYRRSITSAYDHVLVDEYQDVNPGQVGLIDHFVNDGVRLWAVGDDDQTLYAFPLPMFATSSNSQRNSPPPIYTPSTAITVPAPTSYWRQIG